MNKFLPLLLLPLAGCSYGNDRPWIGNPDLPGGAVYLDALKEPVRAESPTTPDAPTLTGISRANWSPTPMMVPVDTTAATRIYSYTVHYADATARQRGQMPTPMSSIETSGDSYWSQFEEAIYSPVFAFGSAILLVPRMVTHSPTHEVRYFPESFWRAGTEVPHLPPAAPAQPPTEPAPAQ